LAVTGSVGKTTTKELVRALLFSAAGAGTASDKSFNNHIGVPYTICQLSQSDNWAGREMGMNHSGELHELSLLAQPDVAIITSVEPVHLEFFGSVNGIAIAKLEIVDGLKKEGTLLLNGDCQVLLDGFSSLNSKVENVELFGKNDNAIIKIGSILKDALSGAEIELNCRGSVGTFTAPLPGAHNAYNVAAAVAGVTALLPKIAIADLDKSFSAFKAPAMRLVAKTIGSVTVIDDSYNANPTAMKAALQILVDAKKSGEKVGAILGEMKELGETGPSLHREVGEVAVGLGIDCLIAVGNYRDEYQAATQGSSTVCFAVESPEEAATRALEQSEIKIWLVKASRGARLDKCVNKLLSSLGN